MFVGLANDPTAPRTQYIPDIEIPKGDDNSENGESTVRGLDGIMGSGLGWLRGQGVVDSFNKCPKGILLVQNNIFRSPGGLVPRNADAIIVLSESWSGDCVNIRDCYRLQETAGAYTGDTVTIVRVAAKGTLEEAVIRAGGHLTALQGIKFKNLSDPGFVLNAIRPVGCRGAEGRSGSIDTISSSPGYNGAPTGLPPSSITHSAFSSTARDTADNKTFLSAAPFLCKGKPSLVSNRSRSNTQTDLTPKMPMEAVNEFLTLITDVRTDSDVLESESTEHKGDHITAPLSDADTSTVPLSCDLFPPPSNLSAPSDSPHLDHLGGYEEYPSLSKPPVEESLLLILAETKAIDSYDDLDLESPVLVPRPGPSSGENCEMSGSKPLKLTAATAAATGAGLSSSSGVKAGSVGVGVGVAERVQDSATREALAERWRRAFLRAIRDVERALHSSGTSVELSVSGRSTAHVATTSLSTLLGSSAGTGTLASLGLPVVKRTYAPRKKSDLSIDNAEGIAEKLAGLTGSPFGSNKGKEDEEDPEVKAMKSRKAERKKDKKKNSTCPATDAITPTTISGTSIVAIPPAILLSSTTSLVAVREEDVNPASDKIPSDPHEGSFSFGITDTEGDDLCESCWSADRMAETLLSLRLKGRAALHWVRPLGSNDAGSFLLSGLTLRMAYVANRDWQLLSRNETEDFIGGSTRGYGSAVTQKGAVGSHSGLFTGPGRPPSAHLPLSTSTTSSFPGDNGGATRNNYDFNFNSQVHTTTYKSHGRLKIKSEYGPGSYLKVPAHDLESRLNRKTLCEADKIRLRRSGLGVTCGEQLFWSLIEPFTDSHPIDRLKETPKTRPPGSFGGNTAALPPNIGVTVTLPHCVTSYRDSLRELKRKGISVDTHVHVHPLQNAMKGDLQLVPTWGRKSAIAESHTQFTVRYVVPRSSSSKSARKSRVSQNLSLKIERDKEPVRKRVLDQPILIPNIRNVRARLETGSNSRPSSLGGTVNPLFTRLPPIRTALKPRGEEIELLSFPIIMSPLIALSCFHFAYASFYSY